MDANSKTCPICSELLIGSVEHGRSRWRIPCRNCRVYDFLEVVDFAMILPESHQKAVFSHAVREMTESGNSVPFLDVRLVHAILGWPIPTVSDQCDKLLRWLCTTSVAPGRNKVISPSMDRAIFGAESNGGFKLILEFLECEDSSR